MDLSTLVKMSNAYGSNPAYVLAGGGNTSVKDDTTLYVKGSGTQLATIKEEEFVEMSRARLNEIMKTDYPEDDVKRESLYLADVMAAVTDADKTKRPSVEALLHNLFAYTYVLHVHPTLVNGLTCGKGAKELSEQLLGKDVLWIFNKEIEKGEFLRSKGYLLSVFQYSLRIHPQCERTFFYFGNHLIGA